MDAKKSKNFGFNLSLKRGDDLLVIDRGQPLADNDTIFLNLTGVKIQHYRFEFTADNLLQDGLQAYLEDAYLQSRKEIDLNCITRVDFNIANIPGSYAPNRFKVVFVKMLLPLPVRFVSIAANRNSEASVKVDWKVENESNINFYETEHSADGEKFIVISRHLPNGINGGNGMYTTTDEKPVNTDNFYRIKAIAKNGRLIYSAVAKVSRVNISGSISIYPNPLVGKTINIRFLDQPSGKYSVQLSGLLGQVVYSGTLSVGAPVVQRSIVLDNQLISGNYQLSITAENGTKTVHQLIIR